MKSNKAIWLLMFVFLAILGQSCQEYGKWDEPSGNQQIPAPEVDPAYSQCADPTMGKEDDTYYIYATNATIDGIAYQNGLLLRTTKDLVSMNIEETTAYVLSDVIDSWAGARLQELDAAIVLEDAVIGQPCLKKINDTWYMFYSVEAGTNASLIAYATASSLAAADWEDQGELLYSDASSAYKAISPSVCVGTDGKIYMAFGGSAGGIFISTLDLEAKTASTPVVIASRSDATLCEAPDLSYMEGQYNLIFTMWNAEFPLTCHAASDNPEGAYTDFADRPALATANFWELTRVITGYQFVDGTMWETVKGVSTYEEDGKYFILHHGIAASATDKTLHIRELHWLKDERMTHRAHAVAMLSPTRYYTDNSATLLTADDIVGDWYYGTLWGHINSGINDPMSFFAGGTYDGGTWDFDESTQVLHLISTEWGNEEVYIKMSTGNDWNHADKLPVFVGSGVNDVFTDYPGVWMKKQTYVGGVGKVAEPTRTGWYAPTANIEGGQVVLFAGNAALEGQEDAWERGLLKATGSNFADLAFSEYILSDVIVNWAAEALLSLDESIDTTQIIIDQPNLTETSDGWILYYTVNSGGAASLIGYATAPTLDGEWTDHGMPVISSTSESLFKASSPSFVPSSGTSGYLVFGESTDDKDGVYGVNVDASGAAGTPVVLQKMDNRIGFPAIFQKDGFYHLYTMYNGSFYTQSASNSVGGTYVDYGNHDLVNGGFNESRFFSGYTDIDGSTFLNISGGLEVFVYNNQYYALHQVNENGAVNPTFQFRKLDFISAPSGITPTVPAPFPAISVQPSTTLNVAADVTLDDIKQTIWNLSLPYYNWTNWQSYFNNQIKLYPNEAHSLEYSADGGLFEAATSWSFDEETNILTLSGVPVDEELWEMEILLSKDEDILVGSGLVVSGSSTFNGMGVLLKFNTTHTDEKPESTDGGNEVIYPGYNPTTVGIYAPTVAEHNGSFYLYSSAPAALDVAMGSGFPLLISNGGLNASGFSYSKSVLTDVKDWAIDRINELNGNEVEASAIKMEQPNLRKLSDSEWRLYYSVSYIPTNISVIGYATADNPEGPWSDQGEILYSDASSDFNANAPCFASSTDGDYLVFGGGHNTGVYPEPLLNQSGVYGVSVNTDGTISGTPVALYRQASDQLVGQPLILTHGGYWHLIAMQNSFQSAIQGFSDSPLGTYYEFGGRNVSDTELDSPWNHANIFQGNLAQGGVIYTNPTGGLDAFEVDGNMYVVHQITSNLGAVPTINIRRLDFLDTSTFDATTVITPYASAPIPNVSLSVCSNALTPNYPTANEISTQLWNYQTAWPVYANDAYTNLSNDGAPIVFAFKADGGVAYNDLAGSTINGTATWDYNEETGLLHFFNSEWNEHIYVKIYKQNGELFASGLNASFGDRPLVYMKQKTE